ncbi:hypothetical protein DEO72_LG4g1268 [Vigna unguiculata]|uniref:Uncharacterized protein n=1 Tax=Vigna unguiculata TaxID=3917 RepID=A0A4D6LPC0_VIGUN|nr:hypothetical protein DEO72_LG4g1268 [Vigna unguiculata]
MPGRGGPNTRTPLPGGGGMLGRGGGGAGIPGRGGAGGPLTICSGGGGPAATTLLVPKVGYRLAAELRRAGVFVKIVQDKSQAADWALKRQMVHSMSRGIDWLFLVSDDSDFSEMLRKAWEANLGTVVVGDWDRALGRDADLWVPWNAIQPTNPFSRYCCCWFGGFGGGGMPGRGGPNTRTPLPGGGGMPGRGGGGAGIPGRGGAGGPLTICSGGGGPAATTLLVPKVGYRLAAELRRAGVFVKIVQDKSQAADWALKRQMVHSMSRGIDWLFLVSDDSDFSEMLRKAWEANLGTVVVGDWDRALGRDADLWVPWNAVENGDIWPRNLEPQSSTSLLRFDPSPPSSSAQAPSCSTVVVLVVVMSRFLLTLFQRLAKVFSREGSFKRPAQFERASISPKRGGSRLSETAQRPLFQDFEPSPRRRELA